MVCRKHCRVGSKWFVALLTLNILPVNILCNGYLVIYSVL